MGFYYTYNGVSYEIQLSIEELCELINLFFEEHPYEALLKLEKRWSNKNVQDEPNNWFSALVQDCDLENISPEEHAS